MTKPVHHPESSKAENMTVIVRVIQASKAAVKRANNQKTLWLDRVLQIAL